MSFLANIWQKITGQKPSGASHQGKAQPGLTRDAGQTLWIFVECANCGEHIKVMLRKTSEIQRRDGVEREGGPGEFYVRKTIIGSKCYKPIEAEIEFDRRYQVIESHVINGRLIPRSEYKEQ
ncbi:MAG: hypothetical protein GX205_06190 [Firmicutes bacterium]|nr:hypothetical protein [Bacillota bacterium]